MGPDSLRVIPDTVLVGWEEEKDMNFKLTPVKCKYHDISHDSDQERCLACGELYDRKKAKLLKYLDKMRKKK